MVTILITFHVTVITCLSKIFKGGRICFDSQFEGSSPLWKRRSRSTKQLSTSHPQAGSREMNAGAQLNFSFLSCLDPQLMGWDEVFHPQLLCAGLIRKASQTQSSYTLSSKQSSRNLKSESAVFVWTTWTMYLSQDSYLSQDQAWKHCDPGRHLWEHHPLLPGHAAVSEDDPHP